MLLVQMRKHDSVVDVVKDRASEDASEGALELARDISQAELQAPWLGASLSSVDRCPRDVHAEHVRGPHLEQPL